MKSVRFYMASVSAIALAACATPASETPEDTPIAEAVDPCIDPAPDYPVDLCVDMIPQDVGPAPAEEPVLLDACPDDGPRLPASNVCKGRAVNFMNTDDLAISAPDGCIWETQELDLLLDEVILYRSLTCGEQDTRLKLEAGAQSATIVYGASALGHEQGGFAARLFGGNEDTAPESYLTSVIERGKGATCEIGPPSLEGWPSDALVIGVRSPDGASILESDCGAFSFLQDANAYWRLVDDFAIYFDSGQDVSAIDPASFTIIKKR